MRLKHFFIGIILALILPITAQSSSSQHHELTKQKIIPLRHVDSPITRLGDGYFTYNHMAAGETALNLNEIKVIYGNMQSTIFLTQTIDHNELAKILNIDISANGGWGLFSSSASASYLNHTEDNQFTENFSFMERYYVNTLLDISSLPANISALTTNAADLYTKAGIKSFTDRFGDTFITELPLGAMLITNVQLNFATALDKQKFDATIGGKVSSIFSAALSIENAITKSKVKGFVEISAYQIGGNPEELPKIFTKKADQGYYLTTCSLENLSDCRNVINGIIEYAQVHLRNQINPASVFGEKPQGNLVVVGEPFLTTYTSKFNLSPAPKINSVILKNRLELATIYKNTKINKIFFDHYVASPVSAYFSMDAFKLIKQIQDDLDWNLSLANQFGALCYVSGDENNCGNALDAIKTNSKNIDPQVIDFYRNHGFNQIALNCNYIPVGTPTDKNPIYANFCFDQWIKGLFVFKLSDDKKTLQMNGDYISAKGNHVQSAALLQPYYTNIIYTGMATFRDTRTGDKHERQITIKLTRNNV